MGLAVLNPYSLLGRVILFWILDFGLGIALRVWFAVNPSVVIIFQIGITPILEKNYFKKI